MRFRKKPVVIEAMRWTGIVTEEFAQFLQCGHTLTATEPRLLINTAEGTMAANVGDWIIRGVKGEFYPCKPDIFAATYDALPTPPPRAPEAK